MPIDPSARSSLPGQRPPKPEPKKGRLSKDEVEFVIANAKSMTNQDIAKRLNRPVEMVKKCALANLTPEPDASPQEVEEHNQYVIKAGMRSSEAWKNLKEEITPSELKLFEEKFVRYMRQFKNNVLPTEETQIFQMVNNEIRQSRNAKETKNYIDGIERLEKMIADLYRANTNWALAPEDDKAAAANFNEQIISLHALAASKTNEHLKLVERHESLAKQLKATRDQRVKEFEDAASKTSWLGVIKSLSEKDNQEREGRYIRLTDLAGKKEYDRLGGQHTYEDGTVDRPILSADTVDLYPDGDD